MTTRPNSNSVENIYPCVVCQKHCSSGIQCFSCNMWCHYLCTLMPTYSLVVLTVTNRRFTCQPCAKLLQDYHTKAEKIDQDRCNEPGVDKDQVRESGGGLELEGETDGTRHYARERANTPVPDLNLSLLHTQNSVNEMIPSISLESQSVSTASKTQQYPSAHSSIQVPPNAGINTVNQQLNSSPPSQENTIDKVSQKVQANTSRRICRHHRRGVCKFGRNGENCSYDHPKYCLDFLEGGVGEKGCKFGKLCKFLHPHICDASWHNKHCWRPNCNYIHLKGTRMSNNSNSYNPQFSTRSHLQSLPKQNKYRPSPEHVQPKHLVSRNNIDHAQSVKEEEQIWDGTLPRQTTGQMNFLEQMMGKVVEMEKQSQIMTKLLMERMEHMETRIRNHSPVPDGSYRMFQQPQMNWIKPLHMGSMVGS